MKKNLLLILIAQCCIFNFASAQWEQKADPLFTKDHGIGFSLDGFGYVLTGGANGQVFSSTKDFFKYDPNTDTWQQLADYPGPARGYGIGDTWNDKLYFGFGLDGSGNYLNDLWEWDPATNVFTELPACPGDGRVHPALLADSGKVYLAAGGNDNGNLSDVWIYDIADSTWSQKTDIPGKRHHPYQFTINGEAYVGAGHLSSWYKFDEDNNSWIQLASLTPRVAGSQFSYNGKGYVLSGGDIDHNSFPTGEFWEYDPTVDSWTELCSPPGTSRFGSTQFVIDNYIYLLGGYYRMNGSVTGETTMYRYDLDNISGVLDVDNGISQSGDTLIADQDGAEYQWLDCDNGRNAISGATEQSYIPLESGNFSVEVTFTENNCTNTATSFCERVKIVEVGINENMENNFSFYPNPTKNSLTIELNQLSNSDYYITDVIGKVVKEGNISSYKQDIDVSNLFKGVYIITVGEIKKKFIKE